MRSPTSTPVLRFATSLTSTKRNSLSLTNTGLGNAFRTAVRNARLCSVSTAARFSAVVSVTTPTTYRDPSARRTPRFVRTTQRSPPSKSRRELSHRSADSDAIASSSWRNDSSAHAAGRMSKSVRPISSVDERPMSSQNGSFTMIQRCVSSLTNSGCGTEFRISRANSRLRRASSSARLRSVMLSDATTMKRVPSSTDTARLLFSIHCSAPSRSAIVSSTKNVSPDASVCRSCVRKVCAAAAPNSSLSTRPTTASRGLPSSSHARRLAATIRRASSLTNTTTGSASSTASRNCRPRSTVSASSLRRVQSSSVPT